MADLQTVKIRDLIETQQVMTTDYMVLEKDTGTFKCQARYLKGATGLTPNITIGSTLTLPPGQQANVTLSGNTENPIFSFGIPQGVQGQTGPQGPTGPTPDITPLKEEINNRFNTLTSQQQGDSEVIEARGGYPALKARLDAINDDLIKYNDQTIVTHTTENNFSSIDGTKNGYLDNILLEGKTLVVDSNNNVVIPGTQGAILKSVGDGVTEIKLESLDGYGNLVDIRKSIKGKYWSSTNTQTSEPTSLLYEDYINVEYGMKVWFNSTNQITIQVCTYDFNKNFMQRVNITTGNLYTVQSGVKFIRVSWYQCGLDYKTMCNYGTSLKPYVDYKSNTKKVLYKDTDGTWKKPTLRQGDSVEKHSDGKYYYHKRSGSFIMNSSLEYITQGVPYQNVFGLYCNVVIPNSLRVQKVICDKLNSVNATTNVDGDNIFISSSGKLNINILKTKASTIDEFKSLLPFECVYKFQNEEVYECTPIDLISYDTQTNYSIECGPIYPKTTLKVNSYLGNVVSILKDKVSYLENMLVDGLKLVVAGNMQELAYQLYPQDFVDNSVDMEVIK